MRLTGYTDYSMRVLLYLGARPGRLCSVAEISRAYGISQNHLMKVVNGLGRLGYVASARGRSGGIRLAVPADQIPVGKVVRETEDGFDLVDCQRCVISSACGFASVLDEALLAFMAVLDKYTLEDLLSRRADLLGLFKPDAHSPIELNS
jgi:Rrf2 family transcriptional regulator, nitric oxide-sensitive transcriptional repressor